MADAQLRALLDERAIRDVLQRYCRGIDRLDEELIRSTYHADSYDDHGTFRGNGHEFATYVVKVLGEHAESTMHDLGNSLIELDGDTAHAETYVTAYHVRKAGDDTVLETVGGRYVDRLERRDGEWKIAHRTVVLEWGKVETIDAWPGLPAFWRGRRTREDLAYSRELPQRD